MFDYSPIGRLFVPGKIIQIRRGHSIERIAFVEVQEHIRHVRRILDFLYPGAGQRLRLATECHDLGKKFLNWRYINALRSVVGSERAAQARHEQQANDFSGTLNEGDVSPYEAFAAYKVFLLPSKTRKGALGRRLTVWSHRDNPEKPEEVTSFDFRLEPPFGFHAAEVDDTDLPASIPKSDRGYVLELIHLHHSFQADRLVEAAAEHGEQVIHDLYSLMVCDHFGSGWADHVVQALEHGDQSARKGVMRFAEFDLQVQDSVREIRRDEPHVHGNVTLLHGLQTLELDVHYHVFDFHLDGAAEARRQSDTKQRRRK